MDVDSAWQFVVTSFAVAAVPEQLHNDEGNHPDFFTLFECIQVTEGNGRYALEGGRKKKTVLRNLTVRGKCFTPTSITLNLYSQIPQQHQDRWGR
jgi:hypothetical protein